MSLEAAASFQLILALTQQFDRITHCLNHSRGLTIVGLIRKTCGILVLCPYEMPLDRLPVTLQTLDLPLVALYLTGVDHCRS